jgi:CheY-like chemotaxis protein
VNDALQETLLVVDDDETVLRLSKLILSRGGYRVLDARSGPDALRLSRTAGTPIRLALLDVVMPGMNGFELAAQLRQSDPNIEIVLMSGYTASEVRNLAGGDHPYRVIWKPFKTDSLLRMIQTVLDDSPETHA